MGDRIAQPLLFQLFSSLLLVQRSKLTSSAWKVGKKYFVSTKWVELPHLRFCWRRSTDSWNQLQRLISKPPQGQWSIPIGNFPLSQSGTCQRAWGLLKPWYQVSGANEGETIQYFRWRDFLGLGWVIKGCLTPTISKFALPLSWLLLALTPTSSMVAGGKRHTSI